MSEDLSAVEDDEAAEEREMEQLMAAQQKEAADMQRRHTQQMQEKREALRRQKLERKSMLGGAHGTGSASSMSSLDYSHSGSARPSMDGLANASSFAAPAAGSGRPPIAKPASHVQQGAAGAGPDTTGIAGGDGCADGGSRGTTVDSPRINPRRRRTSPYSTTSSKRSSSRSSRIWLENSPRRSLRRRNRRSRLSRSTPRTCSRCFTRRRCSSW